MSGISIGSLYFEQRRSVRKFWIKGPVWDSFFVLNWIPLALIVLFSRPSWRYGLTALWAVVETAHALSPILMVWTHRELRIIARRRWVGFVALPGAFFAATVLAGLATSAGFTSYRGDLFQVTGYTNPFPILMWLYWGWNIFHFGRQNFGVLSIYLKNLGQPRRPWVDSSVCVLLTAIIMTKTEYDSPLILLAVVLKLSHWITELGLTSLVAEVRWQSFMLVAVAAGVVGLLWYPGNAVEFARTNEPFLLSLAIGLFFAHAIYDQLVWKFSDPEIGPVVRKALGPNVRQARGFT
jgi:hypothetical protein